MRSQKVLYIGNNLRGSNTNVTTIETLSKQLQSIGYEVLCYSSLNNKLLRVFHMLMGVVKHRRSVGTVLIDTYSTQNFYYAVAVGNLCRLFRIPYIPILHGGNLPERLKKSKSNSYKLFNGAKINVAPSNYLLDAFKREGYSNLVHIPNTIEINNYQFVDRTLNRTTNRIDSPKLLWVRSFAEIYNPMLALASLEILLLKFPKASLTMVGPDKDGSIEKCRSYAQVKNLPVTFTGRVSKKEWCALAVDFDLFINTTNYDNTPVSVIEAMALGLPIVSTNVGGMPYLIDSMEDGILVPAKDSETMANMIEKICEDLNLYKSLATKARQKVTNFDWKKVKLQWQELLRE